MLVSVKKLSKPTGPEPKPEFTTDNRTYRIWLDPNQYQSDMTRTVNGEEVDTLVFSLERR